MMRTGRRLTAGISCNNTALAADAIRVAWMARTSDVGRALVSGISSPGPPANHRHAVVSRETRGLLRQEGGPKGGACEGPLRPTPLVSSTQPLASLDDSSRCNLRLWRSRIPILIGNEWHGGQIHIPSVVRAKEETRARASDRRRTPHRLSLRAIECDLRGMQRPQSPLQPPPEPHANAIVTAERPRLRTGWVALRRLHGQAGCRSSRLRPR